MYAWGRKGKNNGITACQLGLTMSNMKGEAVFPSLESAENSIHHLYEVLRGWRDDLSKGLLSNRKDMHSDLPYPHHSEIRQQVSINQYWAIETDTRSKLRGLTASQSSHNSKSHYLKRQDG